MKTVYFVRHGQTCFNRDKRLQGWLDSPLSGEGKEQVRHVAKALKELRIDHAFVSPLGRARETLEILRSEKTFSAELTPHLREVSFGDFEGNTLPELDKKFPGMWEARMSDKWNFCPPNGEANRDAVPRAQEIVRRIASFPEDHSLLIVAHFAINRIILSLLANIPPEETILMNVPHLVVYRAQLIEDQWRVSYFDTTTTQETGFQEGWLLQHQPENLPTGG